MSPETGRLIRGPIELEKSELNPLFDYTDAVADLSIDGKVDHTDLGLWIHDHRKSYFGDANLDGQFDSQDLTLVFQAGEYEDLVDGNSGWADGDWNADGEF